MGISTSLDANGQRGRLLDASCRSDAPVMRRGLRDTIPQTRQCKKPPPEKRKAVLAVHLGDRRGEKDLGSHPAFSVSELAFSNGGASSYRGTISLKGGKWSLSAILFPGAGRGPERWRVGVARLALDPGLRRGTASFRYLDEATKAAPSACLARHSADRSSRPSAQRR